MQILSLRNVDKTDNVELAEGFRGEPDDGGLLVRYAIELPDWTRAVHYAAQQRYDALHQGDIDIWPDGFNRVQPLAIDTFEGLKRGGLFLVLELAEGGYLALLPLVGRETLAWFEADGERLTLCAGTLGSEPFSGDLPLLAWARDDSLYVACDQVWRTALRHRLIAGTSRPRSEKNYPDIFRYLGWCSWEQYRMDISEAVLVGALRALKDSGVPVRYALVDDGHNTHEKRRLKSLDPDPAKFPNGWDPVLAERDDATLPWIGLWLNFNGYWSGIDPENDLGELNQHLEPVPNGALQPRDRWLDAFAWYDAFIGRQRAAGFDFVKVDNQASNVRFYRGTRNGVRPAVQNSQALEAACARHLDGLINCMAHNAPCAFNTRVSAVTRCSEDYLLNDAWRAKAHLHNSYGNLLWLGPTVWGDHDMFHSCDRFAGRLMAVSKAVSGGPVYLSDDPADFLRDNIDPLCFADGLLLRPLAPAAPLPDSAFADPFGTPTAYRVIAPLAGGAAAVVVYNLTEPTQPVDAAITADDYRWAGNLIQETPATWDLPPEGLVLFDWQQRAAVRLDDPYTVRLTEFDDRLCLLCPINHGWAVIGRADKFLSPAAVDIVEAGDDELIVQMAEAGPLWIWCAEGTPTSTAGAMTRVGVGLWALDLPIGERRVVRLRRG